MLRSDEIGVLAAALCAAQAEFTAIPKGSNNPFFKSKYAELPDVVKAASPILTKHDLAVTQLLGHDESGDTLTTVVMHKSGQFIADTMHLRPVKDDPQAQGSATTYGRRYSYMAALGLVADEDDDGNAASGADRQKRSKAPPPPPPPPEGVGIPETGKPASGAQSATGSTPELDESLLAELRELWGRAGWDVATLKWHLVSLGVESPLHTDEQVGAAMRHLIEAQAYKLRDALRLTIDGGSA